MSSCRLVTAANCPALDRGRRAADNSESRQPIGGTRPCFSTCFATIIRYADRANISRSICLADIEGIVLIDEIDSHLHVELQHKVLPKILQLFPKVQFLVSSHSPLFVLGMEHVYGEGGVDDSGDADGPSAR